MGGVWGPNAPKIDANGWVAKMNRRCLRARLGCVAQMNMSASGWLLPVTEHA